jgi:YD repeat-containing protein
MMSRFILVISILGLVNLCIGQPQAVYVPPAPDVLGLAKLANIPVSHYTGAASVNIPIGQVGGREVSIPIGLSYNSSGHKVNEMAGSVGLGWNLQAGGLITRITRGLPDDQVGGFCKSNPSDKEPDLFFYNFLGQSGKFVLDQYGRAIMTPYRDLIIKPGVCTSGSNGTWEIIDEQGVIYKFGVNSLARETTTVTDSNGSRSYVSTWFLTEVKSPNGTEILQLSYTTSTISSISPYYKMTKDPCNNNTIQNLSATINLNTRHISSISGPLGSVNFSYSSGRADIPTSIFLNAIQFKDHQSQQVQKYRFEYGYFRSDGCFTVDCFRLRLDKIFDLSPDPIFNFTYNTSVNLPSRNSKKFDHWGYYNGNTVDSWFPQITYEYTLPYAIFSGPSNYNIAGASREPEAEKMLANILIGMNQRGGGSKQFLYEPHSAGNTGTNQIVGGARIKQITIRDGMGQSYLQSFNYTTQANPSLSSGFLYKKPRYMIAVLDPDPVRYIYFSHSFNEIFDIEGTHVGYSRVEESSPGKGKTVYTFTNFDSHPNVVEQNSYVSDYSWKRGKLIDTKVYSESNNLLTSQSFAYDLDQPNKKTVSWTRTFPWAWNCSCGFLCSNSGDLSASFGYNTISRPVLLVKTTSKIYDPNNVNKLLSNVTEYTYDPITQQVTQAVRYEETQPTRKYITKNKFVTHNSYLGSYDNCSIQFDACTQSCQTEPDGQVRGDCYSGCQAQYNICISSPPAGLDAASLAIYRLRNRHQVAVPIEVSNLFQEGATVKLLSSNLNIFDIGGTSGNHIQLKEIWAMTQLTDEVSYQYSNVVANGTFQKDSRLKKRSVYNSYDQNSGNLLQETSYDGVAVSYQWETNNKYVSTTTVNPGINSRVKSYIHKPLVGLTSITDANGISTQTEYDVYNRLKLVKDNNGNILKRYRYHYQNETPGFRVTSNRVEGFVNDVFTFYATDVAVSVGGTPSYSWDFGDGTIINNSNATVNHTYASQGAYVVKLTVTNDELGSTTRSMNVQVVLPMSLSICVDGPVYVDYCGIEPTYYGGCTDLNTFPYSPTQFTIGVTNGCQSSLTYNWEYRSNPSGYWTNLGNSITATLYIQSFQQGNYEFKCTVTDACSDQESTSTYVYVYKSDPQCQGGIQH